MGVKEQFTDERMEVLTELVNIGIGRAGASLSEMVERRVQLQVPRLNMVDGEYLLESIADLDQNFSMVEQRFRGEFNGVAALMFRVDSASSMVCLLMGEEAPDADELEAEKESILTEVGNVLINGIMGSMSNVFKERLHYDVPEYDEEDLSVLCAEWADVDAVVLLAQVEFTVEGTEVVGRFMLLFDLGGTEEICQGLDRLLEDNDN